MKQIGILGSTGSIGLQTLEVVRALPPGTVQVAAISAQRNAEALAAQILEFRPRVAAIGDASLLPQLQPAAAQAGTALYAGPEGLLAVAQTAGLDLLLTAVVGYAGLAPTLAAIDRGVHLAIANKETLVVAGELVMARAREKGVQVLPVDSEHSAIFQCLQGERMDEVNRLILTASGGPFRGKTADDLRHVTLEQALKHPNWSMGAKITIDSASLMNKGLELIEAARLYNLPESRIDVVVHPQSIVHSAVEFADGSIKAQLGLPDMRLPIQYALTYPHRPANPFPKFSFAKYPSLTFEAPDEAAFRALPLARRALNTGGNLPCILNAANEVAVAAFLDKKINFTALYDLAERAMDSVGLIAAPSLADLEETDTETRRYVRQLIFN